MNNPLMDNQRNAKSIPERNNEKGTDGTMIPKSNAVTSSVLMDDLDYLLYGTEEQYEAYFEPEKKKTRKMRRGTRMCFLLMLLGGVIMTVSSSVCAVYVGLTYQDVHSSYKRMNDYSNPFAGINVSDIEYMKDQMRSINHCITERYCKRIEETLEDENIVEL
jgi:hypothetical protein|tara:strand:- start:88 stop:573 length:486 start_codon:yes stop_codon:yes gene_type:complete